MSSVSTRFEWGAAEASPATRGRTETNGEKYMMKVVEYDEEFLEIFVEDSKEKPRK